MTKPVVASLEQRRAAGYLLRVHVSQLGSWLLSAPGWKRWVFTNTEHRDREHLSEAEGNFLGSSSWGPFGAQPHQNQLCVYLCSRHFMVSE